MNIWGDGKGTINLYYEYLGGRTRNTFYHEVGHSFSHKVGYDAKETYDRDYSHTYLADSKDYKEGRRKDRKLNGDFYATEYGQRSKDKSEEQADVTMAMLLKATSKNDPKYNKRVIHLPKYMEINGDYTDIISVDDFLERYPNRVEALNKYMRLDL